MAMTTEFLLRISIAALMGGLIGVEREYRAKEAGIRTHFLVALGSALFMILSQYGFVETDGIIKIARYDPARIAAQVVSGIGFIGAGTIIFQKNVVRGLTTAAGLWVTAAIGMTCGAGMYVLAAGCTALVLICLEVLHIVLRKVGSRSLDITFSAMDKDHVRMVLDDLKARDIEIDSYEMHETRHRNGTTLTVNMEIKVRRDRYSDTLMSLTHDFEGITIEKVE